MSDNYLRLIPHDPYWLPSAEVVITSLSTLRRFVPAAENVSAESENQVKFFDAGENSRNIACPSCGNNLQDWWGDAMNEAWKSKFENLAVVTPCCYTSTSLNDLVYTWPMAFGRFALVAANPGVASLASEQLKEIDLAIGSHLKVVWQHI